MNFEGHNSAYNAYSLKSVTPQINTQPLTEQG